MVKVCKLYDFPCRINNLFISNALYKLNKIFLNLTYPKLIKNVYGLDPLSNTIISLTSFPERIATVWITVETLLHQTKKPQAIILWLAEEQFPNREDDLPQSLLELIDYGLTIRFCDNLYPHKKYFYSMIENPECNVITVDDDVFYPEYLVEELEQTSKKFPNTVCCTWAHEITMGKDKIKNYSEWKHGVETNHMPSLKIMPVGCGGVLYPPHCLYKDVCDLNKIKKLCLRTDDLWLKCMALLNNIPSVRINRPAKIYMTILSTQKSGLHYENVKNKNNDISMKNILNEYQKIELILAKKGGEKNA